MTHKKTVVKADDKTTNRFRTGYRWKDGGRIVITNRTSEVYGGDGQPLAYRNPRFK